MKKYKVIMTTHYPRYENASSFCSYEITTTTDCKQSAVTKVLCGMHVIPPDYTIKAIDVK